MSRIGLAMLIAATANCAVGPDFVRPKAPPDTSYLPGGDPKGTASAEGHAQRFASGTGVPEDWWRVFGSTDLDAFMEQALIANATLETARASLRRSEDNLKAGYGIFFPQVSVSAGAERERFSPAAFGSVFKSSTFNLFTLSSAVSYPLDIFGGERRTVENLRAQMDQQRYTLAATWLSLSGNLVNAVVARAAYQDQITATEALLAMEKEQIQIIQAQVEAGTTPYLTLVAIQAQVSATEATVPPLRQRIDQADHLLATLAGRPPAEWESHAFSLAGLELPEGLPLTLPSQLVAQRPDILAAEAQLHASSASIGVATAAMLPSITLTGDIGVNNSALGSLFSGQSLFWAFGAGLAAPIFRGGTLWFQRKAAIETWHQALAIYRETVLGALAQVADTLTALKHDAELLQAQSQALDAAATELNLVRANYSAGTTNYLQLLVANGQYEQAKLGEIQARAQRLQDSVALFVALGGGWQAEKRLINPDARPR